jgi:hypothetical protein
MVLTGDIMRHLVAHPQVLSGLPDRFELVILPDNDSELQAYNLNLLAKYGAEGKPVVFARLRYEVNGSVNPRSVSFYAPVPA